MMLKTDYIYHLIYSNKKKINKHVILGINVSASVELLILVKF